MLFRRSPRLPATVQDYQALAFEEAESLVASTPAAHREELRLRARLLPSPDCSAEALSAWFVDGLSEGVAQEWEKHLARTGFGAHRKIRLTFEVVSEDALPETSATEQLRKRGVVVSKDRVADRSAELTLEVENRTLLEGSGDPVVLRPGRVAYIGRQRRIRNASGVVIRTNTLAFRDDPELSSISRRQASIRYDSEVGRFELHDGHGHNRTQVLRHGQPVERARPLPTPLEDGDILLLPGDVEVLCRIGTG